MRTKLIAAAVGLLGIFASEHADACSRIVYAGDSTATALRIVGRSLDWRTPIPTNLYVYPRGMAKVGNTLPGSVKWTSKYGSVYAVGYDGGVTEGMNEKGLVINGLFCKGTVYNNADTENRPPMSMSMFVAWLLDMNATTDEVINVLKQHDFTISGATFDGGTVSALHWGVTDRSGHCAIFEFDHGNINIYEGQDIPAMTNDPSWPQMNAINNYWKAVGGQNMLPGTVKSPDRFVRGYYFDTHVEKTNNADLGLSICRSILMNCSVPYKYTVDGEPNLSSTQWRSFANLRDLRYYFDIVTNLGVVYVDLNKCDLRPGAPVLKLDTSHTQEMVGDVTAKLKVSAPFTPMY
ncbi:MAG: linear amide C-N hydrolase [Muribaculaceae bacterium]|nr:linear amide C-N hydrolase [Muribaculaceae bacterium]